ncbi:hypothetical protein WA026_021870 [Henosepilachna vigintioctopunctata]|uniref:Uncharacterized protein n=1 Tax=Henosepilachna vigintioctopunctata TaxID=420089 RepID=A0AAW1UMV6_9CUCU
MTAWRTPHAHEWWGSEDESGVAVSMYERSEGSQPVPRIQKICDEMDLYRLRADELVWALEVRGCEVSHNVEENRRLLRRVMTTGITRSAGDFDPSEELGICFAEDKTDNELKRIRSRLLHVENLIKEPKEGQQVHLLIVVEDALVAVIDAHKIATDTQDTERNNDESRMTS